MDNNEVAANVYSYDECYKNCLEYFHGEELPAKVVADKYLLRNKNNEIIENNPDNIHRRVASELARIEKHKFNSPFSEEKIYSYLKNFSKIIPQGSPLSGIGNKAQQVSLSNCFVIPSPLDSYGGIHFTDELISQISKRRGGIGFDISHIRPIGLATNNSSRTTTGIVPFMERFSNSIREVGQNNRRGAMMLTISIHHPQVLDFITAKRDKTKVTGANISVRLSDEFLTALQNDEDYEQRWPIDSKIPTVANKVSAKAVWLELIKMAWETAEPGILNWDHIIRESPADCYKEFGFESVSTNPCGELILSIFDSCRLMVMNLLTYVKNPFTNEAYFDYEEFYEDCQVLQRFMDDLVDLELEKIDEILAKINSDSEPDYIKKNEKFAWEQIRNFCELGRRTGSGITALGDTLAALNIKYGSEESIVVGEKIYQTLKFGCYMSSIAMAKELGPFKVWDHELEKDNQFLNRIKEEKLHIYDDGSYIDGNFLYKEMKKYGRRNIALLTTAPVGSLSILAQCGDYHGTSSGIEPVFMTSYIRRKKITHDDIVANVDFTDQSGDKWQNFKVYHPTLRWFIEQTGKTEEESPWIGGCAEDIDWLNKVRMQAACQKHVCHSISNTTNLPEDVTVEQVAKIYEEAFKLGCKGLTIYRKNCRTGVLIEDKPVVALVKDRPKEVDCNVHHISVKGKQYVVLVGIVNNKPYEIFSIKNNLIKKKVKHGKIIKLYKSFYKAILEDGMEISPLTSNYDENEEAITRLVSSCLRANSDIHEIVDQLEKVNGDMTSFAKSVARALKSYVKNGTQSSDTCPECNQVLLFQEGCKKCSSCGFSKCG